MFELRYSGLGLWFVLGMFLTISSGAAPKCNNPLPTNCGCDTDQGTIDLSPLDGGSSAAFQDVMGQDGNSYSYNPCTPFTEGDSCNNVAICQTTSFDEFYAIGDQDSVTWGVDGDNAQLTYTNTDQFGTTRTGKVTLVCDQKTEGGTFTATGEDPAGSTTYSMTLTSKYACPGGGGGGGGGLSPGSVLCIVLVVLLFVYLVGGILINSIARGAQGAERIPNVSLWKEFPGLVKDGFVFTFCSCRRGSYQDI